jgi:hypothetical protein
MNTVTQPAYFLGQDVLGDPDQLAASIFTGNALAEDAFLGLAAGTTQYGPCQGGGAIAIIGTLVGATEAAVAAAQGALTGLALRTGPLIVPTGLAAMGGYDVWASCWFAPGDLVYSAEGIAASPIGGYQLGYRLIFRRGGGLVLSGSMPANDSPAIGPCDTMPTEGRPV